jgi:hypothetical protein
MILELQFALPRHRKGLWEDAKGRELLLDFLVTTLIESNLVRWITHGVRTGSFSTFILSLPL